MRFEYGEKSRICFEKRQARAWARIALAFVVAGASGLAWADGEAAGSELQWTVGARFWVADWSSWAIKRSSADYVVQAHADTRLAVIPLMSVQYGKASVSLSSLLGTQYKLAAPSSDDHAYQLNAKRSEFDLNAGYQLLPGLRGILGYKTIQQNFGVNYKWAGPFAGISASSELQGPLGMYGASRVRVMCWVNSAWPTAWARFWAWGRPASPWAIAPRCSGPTATAPPLP